MRKVAIWLIFLIIAIILGVYVYHNSKPTGVFEVYGYSLKSGNSYSSAYFIRTPDDTRILINGGPNSAIIRKITAVLPFYSRRIDVVIVADTLPKNVNGLIKVSERYKIGRVFVPKFASSTEPAFSLLLTSLRKKEVPLYYVEEGGNFRLDEKTGVNILFPADPNNFTYTKSSLPELLFEIKHKEASFLFLSESKKKVQTYIANESLSSTSMDLTRIVVLNTLANEIDLSRALFDHLKYVYLLYSKNLTFPDNKKINLRQGGDVHFIFEGNRFTFERL